MAEFNWTDSFNGAITVCDREGIIVYMNEFAKNQFAKYGGEKLIGTNLLNCHPEPSRSKLKKMLEEPTENTYTIEKNGQKKLIHQTPWMQNGEFCGIVELSILLPADMQHHIRS